MDTRPAAPAFVLVLWTDLVIGFPSGAVQSFTLRPGDVLTESPGELGLTFARAGRPVEVLTFYLQHVAWVSTIKREVPVDPATGLQIAVPPEAR